MRPERRRVGVAAALVAAVVLGARAAGEAAPVVRGAPSPAPAVPAGDTALTFVRDGTTVRTLDLAALRRGCAERTVTVDDPYYETRKRFVGCPLRDVLALGFGADCAATLAEADVFLRARDGYAKPVTGARLLEEGGFLAWGDADREGWQPIDRRQVDPGPYYLVWTGAEQRDPLHYPWPYQLVIVEIGSFAAAYPHTIPRTAAKGTAAWEGFDIFRGECVACHAINGEGGKIGPDLNVPQSIVEYRPRAQIKAYVRDPGVFRHTSMPAHPHLTDAQLDALLAYFDAMRGLKYDPPRIP